VAADVDQVRPLGAWDHPRPAEGCCLEGLPKGGCLECWPGEGLRRWAESHFFSLFLLSGSRLHSFSLVLAPWQSPSWISADEYLEADADPLRDVAREIVEDVNREHLAGPGALLPCLTQGWRRR